MNTKNEGSAVHSSSVAEQGLSDNVHDAIVGGIAEILFVGLPLLVLAIVLTHRSQVASILSTPEWSFAAAVLYGQAVVKLIRSMVECGGFHGERVGLIVAVILILGLVPSLVVLSLILLEDPMEAPRGLVGAQMGLFVLSVLTYVSCCALAAGATESSRETKKA